MILADTSIWIEMFRGKMFRTQMASLIGNYQLCTHPFIVAELACGILPDRQQTLAEFDRLMTLPIISTADVRFMIEERSLFSKGIGFVDAQLIASCLAAPGTQIWTHDKALARVAHSLSLSAALS